MADEKSQKTSTYDEQKSRYSMEEGLIEVLERAVATANKKNASLKSQIDSYAQAV